MGSDVMAVADAETQPKPQNDVDDFFLTWIII